jgi:REP element-mobilizing transposase RayT
VRDAHLPKRKHLRRLERLTIDGPIVFFLTVCVHGRQPVLTCSAAHDVLVEAWRRAEPQHGWLVGRYVTMPDHVHFFASPVGANAKSLSHFVRAWKWSTARRLRRAVAGAFRWQREFFDHLLRGSESYAGKWEYVRQNPVRADLVARPEEWPYQGEISVIRV